MLHAQLCSFFRVFGETYLLHELPHLLHLSAILLHNPRVPHHGTVTMLVTLIVLHVVRMAMLVFRLLCQGR